MAVNPTIPSLIASAERGDPSATEALFTALYSELHRVAKRELARHGWEVSRGATSLLHEAYLDLSGRDGPQFPDRNRFMAYAGRVMRGLILNYVRKGQAQKRGGQFELTAIITDVAAAVGNEDELALRPSARRDRERHAADVAG
jgi:DNA-directed RNA polymerase specialized sigma24 family protein